MGSIRRTSVVAIVAGLMGSVCVLPVQASRDQHVPAAEPRCNSLSKGLRVVVIAPQGAVLSDTTDVNTFGLAVGSADGRAFASAGGMRGSLLRMPREAGLQVEVSAPKVNDLGNIVAIRTARDGGGEVSSSLLTWDLPTSRPKAVSPIWTSSAFGRTIRYSIDGLTRDRRALVTREYANAVTISSLVSSNGTQFPLVSPWDRFEAKGVAEDGTVTMHGTLGRAVPPGYEISGSLLNRGGQLVYLPKLDPSVREYAGESAPAISPKGDMVAGTSSGRPVWWDAKRSVHRMFNAPRSFVPIEVNSCGWVIGEETNGGGQVPGLWHRARYATLDARLTNLPVGWRVCRATSLSTVGVIGGSICPISATDHRRLAVYLTPSM